MSDGGKGSKQRPTDKEKFDQGWDRIFGRNKMQVRVEENKEEIGKCGCGRSPTGKCIGWHALSEELFKERLEQYETGKADLSGNPV